LPLEQQPRFSAPEAPPYVQYAQQGGAAAAMYGGGHYDDAPPPQQQYAQPRAAPPQQTYGTGGSHFTGSEGRGSNNNYARAGSQARARCVSRLSFPFCRSCACACADASLLLRCVWSQNVGNFMTDRNSSRVLAPPGGASSISFGGR
jgi:SPIRAL1-like protein